MGPKRNLGHSANIAEGFRTTRSRIEVAARNRCWNLRLRAVLELGLEYDSLLVGRPEPMIGELE
jgi:hypothetical protein